jgi:hypothetical protein
MKGQLLKAECDLYLSVCLENNTMAYVEKGDILLFIKSWKVKDFLNIKLLHEDIICIFTLSDLDDISEYFSCVCLNTL